MGNMTNVQQPMSQLSCTAVALVALSTVAECRRRTSGLSRIILLVHMSQKASIYAGLPAWSQEK